MIEVKLCGNVILKKERKGVTTFEVPMLNDVGYLSVYCVVYAQVEKKKKQEKEEQLVTQNPQK